MIEKKIYSPILIGILVLFGLHLTSLHSYLLFHSIVEMFSIVVACGIFMLAWNARRFLENTYLLFLGIAYLFVGGLDLIHTLAYTGMGVFEGYGTNLPTQLWIATRYVESLSLLIAPLLLARRLKMNIVFLGYVSVTSLLLVSIFYWNLFPACFIEGIGLTPFKKISEYTISLILLASIAMLLKKGRDLDISVLRLLIASIVLTIVSELAFTLYVHAYGLFNMIGHYLKIISFYLIYKAIIETGLVKPYDFLFKDLKQSEEALRKERDFTSAVLSTAGALVVVLDREGRIVRFNRACEQLTGYSFEKVRGRHFQDSFIIPEDSEPVKPVFPELRSSGFPMEHENYCVAKDGTFHLIMWSYTTLLDDEGSAEYVIGTGIDITERKKTEEELRKLSRAVEQSPATVMITDAEGTIEYVNPKFAELTGYTPAEVIGQNPRILKSGKQPVEFYRDLWETITRGRQWRGEFLNRKKNGDFYWEEALISPIKNDEGVITHFVGVKEDVTERKRAEAQIIRAKQEWERTFDTMPDLIMILNTEYRVVRANKAMADRLGSTTKDLVGQICYDAFHGTEKPTGHCPHARLMADGLAHSAEVHEDRLGGDFLVSVNPLHDPDGKLTGSVHVARDITARKQAEEALRKRTNELDVRVKELNCLYGISHLVEKEDVSLEEILQRTVDLIPSAWRYPEAACARIILEDREFTTKTFQETPWKQKSDIIARGHQVGFLEVCYLAEKPESDKGPFLKGERSLIQAITERLGRIIERKRAEEELRAEKAFSESMLNAMVDTVFVFDPDTGKPLRWNKAFNEISGYADEEIVSIQAPDGWYDEADLKRAEATTKKVFRDGRATVEMSLIAKDGRLIPTEYTGSLVKNTEGKPEYILAIGRDITERKRAREALQKAYDELEQRVDERTAELKQEIQERERAEKALRESEGQLRYLSSQILSAQENERKAVAQELHDSIGQNLAAIKFGTEKALEQLNQRSSKRARTSLETVVSMVQNGIEEVRRIQMDLRPPTLDDLGILATISWFCREFQKIYSGIRIDQQIDIREDEVPDPLKTIIYRVMQESLNNVVKHSKADRVRLSLRKRNGTVELTIEDNGQGFDPGNVLSVESSNRGVGVSSMKERTEFSGGSFSIESTEGKGTIVWASWPRGKH